MLRHPGLFGVFNKNCKRYDFKQSIKINKNTTITIMDKNTITMQEVANDGRSVFLYYDAMAGVYLAFGLSAYYTTMVTEPYMSYSEEMQMPVALLRREHINSLRQSLKKVTAVL